ncbi:hypothetical protein [Lactobacillus helveticus]|uniref:hypothetical protein n=1 Tax=Lactobacillus helveticus TaxID=1587 RepID=UPI0001FF9CB2|nr:hypothetical protein [Lactobacillus helveticus]ADX69888.1 Putative uncharacterized protein [Lactobacillus helveticus H10]NRN83706.1 hypothetical protein [Lactobacillus helveticus]
MTRKKLTEVQFYFENVEDGAIPGNIIEDMQFDGVHVERYQHFERGDIIFNKVLIADNFLIKLDYELANKCFTNCNEPMGERLSDFNDIVDIVLCFEDGTQERIGFPWVGSSEDNNEYQRSGLEVNKPFDRNDFSELDPMLVEDIKESEKNDRFLNRKMLTVYVDKEN